MRKKNRSDSHSQAATFRLVIEIHTLHICLQRMGGVTQNFDSIDSFLRQVKLRNGRRQGLLLRASQLQNSSFSARARQNCRVQCSRLRTVVDTTHVICTHHLHTLFYHKMNFHQNKRYRVGRFAVSACERDGDLDLRPEIWDAICL